MICTTFRFGFHVGWKNQNKHSTLNSSFNALSKWHEPNIRICHFLPNLENHKAFLLVVKTTVCLFSTFYATVILAGYCQKVDCHKSDILISLVVFTLHAFHFQSALQLSNDCLIILWWLQTTAWYIVEKWLNIRVC